jgi:hypothetical protein
MRDALITHAEFIGLRLLWAYCGLRGHCSVDGLVVMAGRTR